jgi:hypothetical protein
MCEVGGTKPFLIIIFILTISKPSSPPVLTILDLGISKEDFHGLPKSKS